jgi:hypothetical protein
MLFSHMHHWIPNIEIATRERLLERRSRFPDALSTGAEGSSPPFFQRVASDALEIHTYHLEGMVDCYLFEGFQQNMESSSSRENW